MNSAAWTCNPIQIFDSRNSPPVQPFHRPWQHSSRQHAVPRCVLRGISRRGGGWVSQLVHSQFSKKYRILLSRSDKELFTSAFSISSIGMEYINPQSIGRSMVKYEGIDTHTLSTIPSLPRNTWFSAVSSAHKEGCSASQVDPQSRLRSFRLIFPNPSGGLLVSQRSKIVELSVGRRHGFPIGTVVRSLRPRKGPMRSI